MVSKQLGRLSRFLIVMLTVAVALGTTSGLHVRAGMQDGGEFAHPEWLADANWLMEHLSEDNVAVVALTPAADFTAGHIPGAAQIDWKQLEIVETDETNLALWQDKVELILTGLGVERGDTVVVYDGGTFIAARLWWVLHQLGHDDVRVLNGGLESWTAAGGEVGTGESTALPAGERYRGEPSEVSVIGIDQAVAEFEQGDAIFVDARRPDDEYALGHIPGAINVPFILNAEEEGIRYWKSADDLAAMYEAAGVTKDSRVITYCATGVRAAVNYFALRQLGYENVTVFTGSFGEWVKDPARPVETPA